VLSAKLLSFSTLKILVHTHFSLLIFFPSHGIGSTQDNMPLPDHAFTLNGGCNCRSIRYRIHVPARLERQLHPFMLAFSKNPPTGEKWKLEDVEADPNFARAPLIITCHCNDCRRSTGSILPFAITVPVQIMEVSVEPGKLILIPFALFLMGAESLRAVSKAGMICLSLCLRRQDSAEALSCFMLSWNL
jgi:hypothetical protein